MAKNESTTSTPTSTTPQTKGTEMTDRTHELTTAFIQMLHDEANGLTRFNEIEEALKAQEKGTPAFAALRKERTQMIAQVRNSRKAQAAICAQLLKL